MARSHARLLFTVWQGLSDVDGDAAKLAYFAVMTEPHTTQCGSGPVRLGRWMKSLGWSEEETLRDALDELEKKRKVLIDWDTDEFLLRSFIRSDEVWRQPQVLRGGLKSARQIESPRLRHELAIELRRVRDEFVGEVDGLTWEVLANEVPRAADLLDGGSTEVALDEEIAGRAAVSAPRAVEGRPPERCPKHMAKPAARACRACGAARDKAREWSRAKDDENAAEARARAEVRRVAIDACARCDSEGYAGKALCDHAPRPVLIRRSS
ncbi:hypothetical protein [Amycolatopsis sp. NPDC051372]|uniref:hypothetical protein n=1 Tax=Amycolatopsis sp. NPDC051372 TaxID=3155669 RepID=UPI003412E893